MSSDELKSKILKQVEFYFGDSNLPQDKFLKGLVEAGEDGYVRLEKISTFKKLKALTTDLSVIADALENSELLKLSSDRLSVKRVTPLGTMAQIVNRSIYAKGFPADSTNESVTEFYEKAGFKILSVRLRRMKNKTFKGSVFVEFESEAEAQRALNEVKKIGDVDLLLYSKAQYHEVKREERIKSLAAKQAAAKSAATETNEDGKRKLGADEAKEDGEPKRQKTEKTYGHGLLVRFTGIKSVTTDALKSALEPYASVAWLDLNEEEGSGVVRFKDGEQEKVKAAVAKLTEEKTEFGGAVPTWSLLEGEEEKKHWDSLFTIWEQNKGGKRGGKGGRGRGRGRGGRGRGRR